MSKFEQRTVPAAPSVSATLWEGSLAVNDYVWDTSRRVPQDPFFAIPSVILTSPQTKISGEDDVKVSISF